MSFFAPPFTLLDLQAKIIRSLITKADEDDEEVEDDKDEEEVEDNDEVVVMQVLFMAEANGVCVPEAQGRAEV